MIPHHANPAGRLFLFFNGLQEHALSNVVGPSVAAVLGHEWSKDWPHVMAAGRALNLDYADASGWLKANPGPGVATALRSFDQAAGPLARFPELGNNNQLAWFMSGFDGTGLMALEYGSEIMNDRRPDPVLDLSDVDALRVMVRQVIDRTIAAEDLDDAARTFVLQHLRAIEDALIAVKVTGYNGMDRAVNEAMGAVRRHPSLLERLGMSPLLRDVWYVFLAADMVLNGAANTLAITEGTVPQPSPVVQEISQTLNIAVERIEVGEKVYIITGLPALPAGESDAEPDEAAAADPAATDVGASTDDLPDVPPGPDGG